MYNYVVLIVKLSFWQGGMDLADCQNQIIIDNQSFNYYNVILYKYIHDHEACQCSTAEVANYALALFYSEFSVILLHYAPIFHALFSKLFSRSLSK